MPASGCPVHLRQAVTLPSDGTPQSPSPLFAELRDESSATPLRYADGHDGWLVTRYDLARTVLEDPRFSVLPHRYPIDEPDPLTIGLDEVGLRSVDNGDLLMLDAPRHATVRRSVTSRFTVRAVKGYQEFAHDAVARQLEHLMAQGSPADLTTEYAQPISAIMHCRVLGVPVDRWERYSALFVGESTPQQKMDFIREVVEIKRVDPGDDVISDVLASDLDSSEMEGVLNLVMAAGRDSVAYMIATTTVALLTNPEQLAILRDDPSLIPSAVEEFVRYGSMFLTVFPRTATEDVTLDGVTIHKGQSVSVSQVSANRDDRRFEHADKFDVTRDAFGHIAFGHGQHGCVGQQLARLEIREAISQLIARIPSMYLVEAEQLGHLDFAHPVATYEAGSVVIGW
jgi:cytochrome P450